MAQEQGSVTLVVGLAENLVLAGTSAELQLLIQHHSIHS